MGSYPAKHVLLAWWLLCSYMRTIYCPERRRIFVVKLASVCRWKILDAVFTHQGQPSHQNSVMKCTQHGTCSSPPGLEFWNSLMETHQPESMTPQRVWHRYCLHLDDTTHCEVAAHTHKLMFHAWHADTTVLFDIWPGSPHIWMIALRGKRGPVQISELVNHPTSWVSLLDREIVTCVMLTHRPQHVQPFRC